MARVTLGTLSSYTQHTTRYTRETGVVYVMQAKGVWRHVDTNGANGADALNTVGPMYATKAELLADHERYMRACWL